MSTAVPSTDELATTSPHPLPSLDDTAPHLVTSLGLLIDEYGARGVLTTLLQMRPGCGAGLTPPTDPPSTAAGGFDTDVPRPPVTTRVDRFHLTRAVIEASSTFATLLNIGVDDESESRAVVVDLRDACTALLADPR
jgi:hypothetical protein